jgi:hypothetical protein
VTALVIGTLFALGALAYVLWPLIAADGRTERVAEPPVPLDDPGEPTEAIAALTEIEFDHATGKLSDADYAALKARYTAEAVAEMRADPDREDDPVEAEIRRARAQTRVCPTCGPRPEPGARYCSSCGVALA